MYVYIYINISMYLSIYPSVYISIYSYIYIYMFVYVYICRYRYIDIDADLCLYLSAALNEHLFLCCVLHALPFLQVSCGY